MKKYLFLLLTVFIVSSCNDECDHGFKRDDNISKILVGSWYEESQNEEDVFSASGTFSGRFCNTFVQGDGQGKYFIDSERNRMTWSANVNGTPQLTDWELTNVNHLHFTMSSDIATLTYGKIVETYTIKDGETKQISFKEEPVIGYESKNANIATVSSDGIITAMGEKGTTYIKIKLSDSNVWAKVIVGDDHPDLWIDYSQLLSKDFSAMKELLGTPSETQDFGDYTSYSYITSAHNILDYINVFINNSSHTITQIDMYIRKGVTQEEVLAYMNSHYYSIDGKFGKQYHYSTYSELEKSRAAYVLNSDNTNITSNSSNMTVMIMPADDYLDIMKPKPWPRFDKFFGLDKEQTRKVAESKGWQYYDEFDTYSFNGSVAFSFSGFKNFGFIEFVFNTDNVVSQCVLYTTTGWKPDEYLLKNYTEEEEEKSRVMHVYYNNDRSIKIEQNILFNTLFFTDLSQKPFDRILLGTYWKIYGKTREEIISDFGEPYAENDAKTTLRYAPFNDIIYYLDIRMEAGKAAQINMTLQEDVDDDKIIDYLNKLYHFYEKEDTPQGPRLRWLNAESIEKATLRTTYYPDYNIVVYTAPNV